MRCSFPFSGAIRWGKRSSDCAHIPAWPSTLWVTEPSHSASLGLRLRNGMTMLHQVGTRLE